MVELRRGSKWSLHHVSEVRIFFELICAMSFYNRRQGITELSMAYQGQRILLCLDHLMGKGGRGGQKGQGEQKREGSQ